MYLQIELKKNIRLDPNMPIYISGSKYCCNYFSLSIQKIIFNIMNSPSQRE